MKKKKFTEKIFDRVEAEVVNTAGDYIKSKIRRKIIKAGEVSLAFLFSFVLLIIGLAEVLASLFSFLENGLNYIILGIVFFIVGMIIK
jgi:hypothetical protein